MAPSAITVRASSSVAVSDDLEYLMPKAAGAIFYALARSGVSGLALLQPVSLGDKNG